MAETWSQLKQVHHRTLPLDRPGANRVGRCESPASSMKTISRPSAGFFEPRPDALLQSSMATSSRSSAVPASAGKAHLPSSARHARRCRTPNWRSMNTRTRLSVSGVQNHRRRSFHQRDLQSYQFLGTQQGWASLCSCRAVSSLGFEHAFPAVSFCRGARPSPPLRPACALAIAVQRAPPLCRLV